MPVSSELVRVLVIGVGATAVMDLWLQLLKRLGIPGLNMAYLGRWVGHLARGRMRHTAIAKAVPIPGEAALGWLAHYLIGVAFAGLLPVVAGRAWLATPSLLPALLVGIGTVVAPLGLMQPAMGAGLAARKTPTPLKNCLRSLANHSVFGLGLYLSGQALATLSR